MQAMQNCMRAAHVTLMPSESQHHVFTVQNVHQMPFHGKTFVIAAAAAAAAAYVAITTTFVVDVHRGSRP